MKLLTLALVIFAAAGSAAAQVQYVPCIANTPAGWSPVNAPSVVYKIAAGGSWSLPVMMPVAGNCELGFDAYDDRDDLAVVIMDAAGRYIRKQPAGDIELMILDEFNFVSWRQSRSFAALFSSGRVSGGRYSVRLPAGYFRLVFSNKHSYLAQKSVTFQIGREQITP